MKISHLQFVVFVVFHFLGDAKQSSLASLRRLMMAETTIYISRGAFWERLAGNRFKKIMESLVEKLMANNIGAALLASDIVRLLKVTDILLIDSSIIKLSDEAQRHFPGTRSKAGIKWHACFDLFSGQLKWFKLTASDLLSPEESLAISFQRTAHVFAALKNSFIRCILNPIKDNIEIILQRINLMIHELYDPNYRERPSSKVQVYWDLMSLNTR